MITYSVWNSFDEDWSLLLYNHFSGFLTCIINSKNIITINSNGWHSVGYTSNCDTISCILIINGCRNGIHIISAEKHSLTSQSSCEVQSRMKISLGCRSFSEISNSDSVLICNSILIPCSWSLWYLSAKRWWYSHNIMLSWSIMHRHLSTLAKVIHITSQLMSHLF